MTEPIRLAPAAPAPPERVIVCGDCDRRADDPAVRSCTDPHCLIRRKEAA